MSDRTNPQAPERATTHLRYALEILAAATAGADRGRNGELVIPQHIAAAVERRIRLALDAVEGVARSVSAGIPEFTLSKARDLL